MKTKIQLILATIALTILIWTYADRTSQDVYTANVAIKVTPPPEPGDPYVLRVVGASEDAPDLHRAQIKFAGPKTAIRQLERDDVAGRFSLAVVIEDQLTPGRQTRDLLAPLGRLPAIRDRGLIIQSVTSQTVTFDVDRYVTRSVEVVLDVGVYNSALVGPPVVKPNKVDARILESSLQNVSALAPLRINIEQKLETLSDQGGGTFEVLLRSSWPGIEASFKPDRVQVTVQIRQQDESQYLTLIPLNITLHPDLLSYVYEIEWQDKGDAIRAVHVSVPIGKAQPTNTDAIAFVTIGEEDLPTETGEAVDTAPAATEGWIEKEVRFLFKPGFEYVKLDNPPRKVKFRLNPKIDPAKSGL